MAKGMVSLALNGPPHCDNNDPQEHGMFGNWQKSQYIYIYTCIYIYIHTYMCYICTNSKCGYFDVVCSMGLFENRVFLPMFKRRRLVIMK